MSTAKKTVEHGRSAVSGRYVTEAYAKSHPNTTIVERRPAPKPAKKPTSKR